MEGKKGIFEVEGYKVFLIDHKPVIDSPFEEVWDLIIRSQTGKANCISGSEFSRTRWLAPEVLRGRKLQVLGRFLVKGDGDSWEDQLGQWKFFEVAVDVPEIRKSKRNPARATILVPGSDMRRITSVPIEAGRRVLWLNGDGMIVKTIETRK